ncbi:MAG TPA: DUF305 domain-containing protein [Gemmatimonadales bacterium]|nr:DUF305 domain-containing protein [Gemmatimonadales bacterium]
MFPCTVGAALAALVLGCSRSAEVAHTAPAPGSVEQSDSAAMAKARADSARYPYTEADVEFMSAMIGHHSQALLMAGWAPSHGAGASVRTLAERVINGQQDEIVTMQRWLRDRGKPIPEPTRMGPSGTGHHGHTAMPGMLTPDQLQQLDQARGSEFDRRFLTFMIQHHNGAVAMVQKLFATPGAARDETVFKFANDVSVDQRTEVARMERMLAGLAPQAGSQ